MSTGGRGERERGGRECKWKAVFFFRKTDGRKCLWVEENGGKGE